MTEQPREESEQLPEEAPADQVADEGQGGSREDAEENAGAADDEGGGEDTGHAENAG